MNKIATKIQDRFYTYTPGEFLPIWEQGKLVNRQAYVAYKLGKILSTTIRK